jgi:valyl-tRNA synthetase
MTYRYHTHPLPAQYDTAATEKKWQDHWALERVYAWDNTATREESFVIDTPPPTVSGHLHMGHVFSYTQADFVARYQRMKGKSVFYPMGFDDNGLPTERLVEKTIKKRASDMSREAFIAECLSVSETARAEFRRLFHSIALSVDWTQEYHTISDSSRRLSQASFLDLVNKGHCYRAERPFYWDPVDQTAIAQAEIIDKDMPSFENTLRFTIEGKVVQIMTTRPELLPSCVALFYHPEDERYACFFGKEAIVPLTGHRVPVLADATVAPDKGTGLMMCCTFGDEADITKWQMHNLPIRMILNKFGKIDLSALALGNGSLVQALQGKKVSNNDPKHQGARETIVQLLRDAGALLEQKPITHAVKCAERSGAPLEILPTHQWFVRVLDKKEALLARTRAAAWHPEWMRLRMEQWIEGLNQDWCISRQRYFGVPFPVWYSLREGEEGKMLFAEPHQLPVNPLTDLPEGYASDEVVPDLDVMDTWATSSISPQLSAQSITTEMAENLERFNALFPADLRPQAHEIIRTWAFYTLVKAHLHNDSLPWKNLMISGWCLAEDKTKMSKSKGNVITPVELIEERGTDAVRYWAATSRLGADTAFSPDLLKIGKKLVGKLWNATQFAGLHLPKLEQAPANAAADMASGIITETLDRWILSRLAQTVKAATEAFERYEYADALDATNRFFWADFCDDYLELVKCRAYNEQESCTASAQQSAVRTLYYCLETVLALYAPFVPHVTEELFAAIFPENYRVEGSLHARGMWPNAAHHTMDETALAIGDDAQTVLAAIRKVKSDAKKSIKYPLEIARIRSRHNYTFKELALHSVIADLQGAGNVSELTWDHDTIAASDAPELMIEELLLSPEAADVA